ncbi:MAG: bifunctional YncE family protein/alkaline phosphatase family protein [Verrucomicrobia bacterium]|nr:bifunctional YncE family protein/alkaline phosphatase family protein [Verrucomicrobiota bacterium]
MKRASKRMGFLPICALAVLLGTADAATQRPPGVPAGSRKVGPIAGGWVLPNGRLLRPWGDQIELPGQPFSLVVTPDGRTGFLLVAANRFQDPWVPDATILASIDLDRRSITRTARFDKRLSVGMGMAYAADAKRLFLADPVGDRVIAVRTPTLEIEREMALPKGKFPVGVAASADGARVFTVANLSGKLIELDGATGNVTAEISVGASPGRVVLSAGSARAFVSNWTDGTVSVVDLRERRVVKTVKVGHHPEAIVELPGGRAILVVVNGQDELAEVDLASGLVRRRISVAPRAGLPPGSSPTAAVLHPDGDRLFVCLAGDDALATVSLKLGRVIGLTPVGWYPVDVALAPDARTVYVANMKSPMNLVPERHPELWHARYGKQGMVSVINTASLPDPAATRATLENVGLEPLDRSSRREPTPDASSERRSGLTSAATRFSGDGKPRFKSAATAPAPKLPSGLKRVVFVLKENHTYDDYFGDLGRGDGDPSLCFYGRAFTPNQHALADRFALCDNFYSEAEMSVEGHSWVEGAYFADVLERFWRLARPHYDVNDPTYWPVRGSIFDECARRGVGYRIYGGALLMEHLKDAAIVPGYVKDLGGPMPYKEAYSTDAALAQVFADDVARGVFARFTYITLWRDHPEEGGRAKNEPLVRDNDEATGIVVEAVSRSRLWKETAVFIVQDDPGNYIDHVATHRVPCLVASPYAKRGFIDSQHYSFPSILRTTGMILGLEPLSRYDWGATPLTDCFSAWPGNKAAFDAIRFPTRAGQRSLR